MVYEAILLCSTDELIPVAKLQRAGGAGLDTGRMHSCTDPIKAEMTFGYFALRIVAGNIEGTGS